MWNPDELVGIPLAHADAIAAVHGEVADPLMEGREPDKYTNDEQPTAVERLLAHTVDPETYADYQAEMVGGIATLEGGQIAQVVTFTDDDRVVVTLATGDTEVVDLSDVVRIVPPAPEPEPEPEPEVDDAPDVELQAAMVMAANIIDAGVKAAYTIEHPDSLVDVPTNFLPDDPAMWEVVEKACAVAIGMLIDATDDTPETIAAFFDIQLTDNTQGDQQTEVANDDNTSETTDN